jgi:Ca2+-binding RTX toxin-like protein
VVVTWFSSEGGNLVDLVLQRFQLNGTAFEPVGDEVIIEADIEVFSGFSFEVADLADGGFIVTYSTGSPLSTPTSFARVFDANGNATSGVFSPEDDFDHIMSGATELANGDILLTWHVTSTPDNQGIFGRIFDKTGTPQGESFTLDDRDGPQLYADTTALDNGGFVSVWQAESEANGDGPIVARAFDANGNPLGDSFQISAGPVGVIHVDYTISATTLSDGTVVAFYEDSGTLIGQRFSTSGQLIGESFDVVSVNSGTEASPDAALNENGDIVVAFETLGDIATETFSFIDDTAVNSVGVNDSDTLLGSTADDTIDGHGGNDLIITGLGDDTLLGQSGFDILDSGAGDDLINAGIANDTLIGGLGNDTLTGGLGNDILVFASNSGNDIVTDYTNDIDILDLTALNLTIDDLTITQAGADTVIELDADNSITLLNVDAATINEDDFLF